jgi:hypothetical protein
MAIYGQERWVTGYCGKNIFLNLEKAEEKRLNIVEMQQMVARFMLEFEGIQAAFPADKILTAGSGADGILARLQNSTNHRSAGDVVITLLPGWLEVDENSLPAGASGSMASQTSVSFSGWTVKEQQIDRQYNIADIAATLSAILGIRQPNAGTGKPIEEIVR